jgi:hypothetical protein
MQNDRIAASISGQPFLIDTSNALQQGATYASVTLQLSMALCVAEDMISNNT